MKPIIEITRISKKFIIQHERHPYLSLRDSISTIFKSGQTKTSEEFWALKDVSAEIYPGESIGIIGKNGAGKSTLLKILSKITPPTSGKIISRGRLASLLEVGTGFHPELTGRENIFLNGSILGMKRKEIASRFDEIIDFSGVEKFLDTPLKHYSSGMQLRLAFSVAAFLEPEILVIDEVLAVGDSAFQQKCINKMNEVSRSGRTILFVSHNMAFINALCSKGILLESGKVSLIGDVNEVVVSYSASHAKPETTYQLSGLPRNTGTGKIRFDKISIPKNPMMFGEKIRICLKLKSLLPGNFRNVDMAVNINTVYNECLIHCCNRFTNSLFEHSNDDMEYCFEIDNALKPGEYSINAFLRTDEVIQDWLHNVASISILDGNPYQFNDSNQIQGAIFPAFSFKSQLS